ncbi:MAG TPA: hypothetical protein VM639_07165 [Dongiaceae bacterium]|nr:hypothetical protein [Dongiaceae bacterium]
MARSANDNQSPAAAPTPETGAAFQDLPFAGQLLVWGMRHWVMALKRQQDFAAMTGEGFAQFGLAAAGQSLDDLFQVVAVSATRQIDIRCIKCRQTSEDEMLLLDCLEAAQNDRLNLAYAGLLEILPPAAARHAMPSLISLAKITAHAGLFLRSDKSPGEKSPTVATDARAAADRGPASHRGKAPAIGSRLLDRAATRLEQLEIPALVH